MHFVRRRRSRREQCTNGAAYDWRVKCWMWFRAAFVQTFNFYYTRDWTNGTQHVCSMHIWLYLCRNEFINTYANRTGQMVVALSRFISRSWWLNATLRFACSTCKPILNAKFYARKCGTRLVMHRFTVCSKRRDEFHGPESVKWTNTNKSRPIWIPCEISSVN